MREQIKEYGNEHFVKYLFITPFCNGCEGILKYLPDGRRLICSAKETDDVVREILKKSHLENIFFNNACQINQETRFFLKNAGVKFSFIEAGWFPHYKTWGFDSQGWLNESLLAKSRLDAIEVDHNEISRNIDWYIKNCCQSKPIDFSREYVLFVMQHTKDSSIIYGYPEFKNWSLLIAYVKERFADDKLLVIKMHPQNANQDKVVLPHDCILIQDKSYNYSLMKNAECVVGVNSTMLYEASLLFGKQVFAFGNSWFDAHPEVVTKIKTHDKIEFSKKDITESDKKYRQKFFKALLSLQTKPGAKKSDLITDILYMHNRINRIGKISDLFVSPKHLGGHQNKTWIDEGCLDY